MIEIFVVSEWIEKQKCMGIWCCVQLESTWIATLERQICSEDSPKFDDKIRAKNLNFRNRWWFLIFILWPTSVYLTVFNWCVMNWTFREEKKKHSYRIHSHSSSYRRFCRSIRTKNAYVSRKLTHVQRKKRNLCWQRKEMSFIVWLRVARKQSKHVKICLFWIYANRLSHWRNSTYMCYKNSWSDV